MDIKPFGGALLTERKVYEALFERGEIIRRNIRAVADAAIGNFSRPDVVHDFPYRTATSSCRLQLVAGTRVERDWFVLIQITNVPIRHHAPDYGRQYLEELVRTHVNGTLSWPLRMKLRQIGNGKLGMWHNDTTTSINNRRWTANAGFLGRTPVRQNPAIERALERAEGDARRATDTKTASNTAILLLPLLLNFVPVSFFARVTAVAMLIYMLLSDVLTVLPLLIKGVEMIWISRQRHYAVVTTISSGVVGKSPSSAGEIFAAECRAMDDVLVVGWVFVAVALVFMVGGVALELLAGNYCDGRGRKEAAKGKGNVDDMFDFVGAGSVGYTDGVVRRKAFG